MAKLEVEYGNLSKLIENISEDVAKAAGGNKTAGTRVRRAMQEVKSAAQNVRKAVLEVSSEK